MTDDSGSEHKTPTEPAQMLQQFQAIQEEFELYSKRMQKLVEHREKFRETVFIKVRNDYNDRLQDLQLKMKPLIGSMSAKLNDSNTQKQVLVTQLDSQREAAEELELRYLVGEFAPDEYEPKRKAYEEKIQELDSQLQELTANSGAIERLFAVYQDTEGIVPGVKPDNPAKAAVVEPRKEAVNAPPPASAPLKPAPPDPFRLDESGELDEFVLEEHEQTLAKVRTRSTADQNQLASDIFAELSKELNVEESNLLTDDEVEDESSDFLQLDTPKPRAEHFAAPKENQGEAAGDSISDYERYLNQSLNEGLEIEDEPKFQEAEEVEIGDFLDEAPKDEKPKVIPILEIIEGEQKDRSFPITTNIVKIGRSPDNEIQLSVDTSVSRNHAQLVYNGNSKYAMKDLNSSNGTFVNGVPIKEKVLKDNDLVVIGQTKIIFHLPVA